jgi:hypothetical protein
MFLFIVYAVFVYYIAPPTVAKPWGYCILGMCARLTAGSVEYIATYSVFINVPLIGTNMLLSWLYKDENPKIGADAYGGTLKFFLIGNPILFTEAFFGGLMWTKTPPIDYLLYIMAFATGVLHFITMRRYFLDKETRQKR